MVWRDKGSTHHVAAQFYREDIGKLVCRQFFRRFGADNPIAEGFSGVLEPVIQ